MGKIPVWKTEEILMKYKEKLKILVASNRSAKINYEQKLAKNVKDNSKSFLLMWGAKRTKDRVGPLKDILGNVVIEYGVVANLLNAYFASVFTI